MATYDDSLKTVLADRFTEHKPNDAIYIIPTRLIDGAPVFSEFDTYALDDAADIGAHVELIFDQPRYLAQHDAHYLASIAFAIGPDLTVKLIEAAARYVYARVRGAIQRGVVDKPTDLHLKVTAAVVDVSDDGLHIEDLTIEADGSQVVDQVRRALESKLRPTSGNNAR